MKKNLFYRILQSTTERATKACNNHGRLECKSREFHCHCFCNQNITVTIAIIRFFSKFPQNDQPYFTVYIHTLVHLTDKQKSKLLKNVETMNESHMNSNLFLHSTHGNEERKIFCNMHKRVNNKKSLLVEQKQC